MSSYLGKLQVNGGSLQPVGSTLYGVCDTPKATAAKEVTLADFDEAIHGVTIHVRFTYGNSAPLNSAFTLKVGSTNAQEISNPGGSVSWAEDAVISFTYDDIAKRWRVNDGNVTSITISDHYNATSSDGISGKGVAEALASYPIILKGVDSTIPSSSPSDNNVPTSAAVASYVGTMFSTAHAMIFKGTIGTNVGDNAATELNSNYKQGWTYCVATAGTYAGQQCEVGDLLVAIADAAEGQATVNNAHWAVLQNNIDSGLFKGNNQFTDAHVLIADGVNGKVKDSGFTIGTSVPANAVFTDTTYTKVANTTIHYLNDANYVKAATIERGTLKITTITNAPTIIPMTDITSSNS